MSLQVWLPLNGNLNNQGLNGVQPILMGTGITYTSGKIGQAATFPNNCNSCIHMSGLRLQTGTFAAWIKINGTGATSRQCIVSEGRDSYTDGVEIYATQAGTSISFKAHEKVLTTTIELNKWYHITGTFGNGIVKLYLNGELKNSNTYTTDMTYTYASDLTLGKMSYSYTNASNYFPFNGQLNDVRIYDHALSAKEVEEIARGLVLHYKLDNNGLGGNNLLLNTQAFNPISGGNSTLTTNTYGGTTIRTYNQTLSSSYKEIAAFNNVLYPELGETYTASFWAKGSGILTTYFYGASGYLQVARVTNSEGFSGTSTDGNNTITLSPNWKRYWVTWTLKASGNTDVYKHLLFRHMYNANNATLQIDLAGVKLEKGSVATSWTPAPSELSNENIIYDTSGYNHNAVPAGAITVSSDSARYNISTGLINGSYIRSEGRPAAILPTDAITVNLWMKHSTWGNPTSCTEGGGFNFENSSGIQFPLYVSGTGYKIANSGVTPGSLANGWHMLTGTFDRATVKIYIDGELKKSTDTGTTAGIGYANNYLFLGAEAGGNSTTPANSTFVGNLSDYRIYATALSAEAIKELYNTSATIDKDGNIYTREVVEI